MADPFLSEIRLCSFSYAPAGWALCNGQFLPINQNQALFALLGTTYGGNGITNFALPDFRGRTPMHVGNGHDLGERAGQQDHTLNISQLPAHQHTVKATSEVQDTVDPTGAYLAATTPSEFYVGTSNAAMNAQSISSIGGSQAHTNMQPYLVISFCIALQGIFPSPT